MTYRPTFARLPRAPITASRVPGLTSIYHKDGAGSYGNRRYPGNCGGELIKDLLLYFQPRSVFDPLTGSGTCRQVCAALGIPCVSSDLREGFDACDPSGYPQEKFDFIFLHPPYWRQKVYSDDPRDLSTSPTLDAFLERYQRLIENCTRGLAPGGKLVVLMGDYTDREVGFVPLTYHTKRLAFACGLRQPCTDIVRFSHNAGSGDKVYRSAFIPGLHDMCIILEKPRHLDRGNGAASSLSAPAEQLPGEQPDSAAAPLPGPEFGVSRSWVERCSRSTEYEVTTDALLGKIIIKLTPAGGEKTPPAEVLAIMRKHKTETGGRLTGLRFEHSPIHGKVWTLPDDEEGRTLAVIIESELAKVATKAAGPQGVRASGC